MDLFTSCKLTSFPESSHVGSSGRHLGFKPKSPPHKKKHFCSATGPQTLSGWPVVHKKLTKVTSGNFSTIATTFRYKIFQSSLPFLYHFPITPRATLASLVSCLSPARVSRVLPRETTGDESAALAKVDFLLTVVK